MDKSLQVYSHIHVRIELWSVYKMRRNHGRVAQLLWLSGILRSAPRVDIMVSLRIGVTASLAVLSLLGLALAIPLADKLNNLSPGARDILKRSTPAAPRFVVYDDAWVSPLPTPTQLKVCTRSRAWSPADGPIHCRGTMSSEWAVVRTGCGETNNITALYPSG